MTMMALTSFILRDKTIPAEYPSLRNTQAEWWFSNSSSNAIRTKIFFFHEYPL